MILLVQTVASKTHHHRLQHRRGPRERSYDVLSGRVQVQSGLLRGQDPLRGPGGSAVRTGGAGEMSDQDSPDPLEGFELVIGVDGTVTFIDFPPEMLEIARALNPDDPLVCERTALLEATEASDES